MDINEKFRRYANEIWQNPKDSQQCVPRFIAAHQALMAQDIQEGFDPVKLSQIGLDIQKSFEVGQKYCFFEEVPFTKKDVEQEIQCLNESHDNLQEWFKHLDHAWLKVNELYSANEITVPDLNPGEKGELR